MDIHDRADASVDIPSELDRAIRDILKSDHPLDQDENFNVVEFVNKRFPDADSLDGVSEYARALRDEMRCLDEEIFNVIRGHASAAKKGKGDLDLAREAIAELSTRVVSIRDRAEESERTVKTVSRDIMLLDTAKKNVGLTVTTLKRLVMMVNACEQLAELAGSREYAQTPALIMSIKDLESAFDPIAHIPRIDELIKHKNRIFTDLKLQIMEDFDLRILLTFPEAAAPDNNSGPRIMSSKEDIEKIDFNGAAQAVDALGDDVRHEIVNKYCLLVMNEYTRLFAGPSGAYVGLEFYDKRFQWLTKALKDFTDKHGNLVPVEWIVNGELCMHFCHETRQHFIDILSSPTTPAPSRAGSAASLTGPLPTVADPADLMVTVLIKCVELENDMQRRFDKVRSKLGLSAKDHFQFKGVITSCFDVYLNKWVQYQERQLVDMVHTIKAGGSKGDELMGDSVQLEKIEGADKRPQSGGDSMDSDPPMVYTSSVTVFASMRSALQRCRQFNSGEVMADLFQVFRRTIALYVDSVLKGRLPTGKQVSAANDDALSVACAVIGSLDYCLKMTPHLHKNCMSLLDRSFDVSVSAEIEKLAEARELAQDAVVSCVVGGETRTAIVSISHLDWWNCAFASGVSAHVGRMKAALDKSIRILAKAIAESHYRAVIELVASKLINQLSESVYSAKPISDIGAQQLLVDLGEIKSILLDLPGQVCPGRKIQQTYTELVHRGLHRLECSLKALSSPACGDKQSLRTMLDSLDPELAQSAPAALEKEVDRILALRKGPTNSATMHAMAPVTAMFGSNLDSHFIDRSPSQRYATNNEPESSSTGAAGTTSQRGNKPDLKADLTKLGASFMKGKLFSANSGSK